MQIGFNLPTTGPLIEPDGLVRIVTEGEALGFDYVTISDHIMVPRNLQSKYPYTCLLYTSPSPRDGLLSRMPSSA